ncbi:MAG TPA: TfuA-like protein [Terracidiphilus sp.]|nr:TfuA-like protein [Terracidiphilus sp.]
MKTIIFAGPSISHQELAALTTADLAPPIRRGDIDRFADYGMFVIIDGEFGQSLSVSPKEILGLLRAGKTVIGASSMGALRASELDGCGMIGVGWVYEHFASAAVRRDDDVALAYSPLDLCSVTVPVIEIEYWTTLLLERNLISAKDKKEICQVTRKIFYAERTESRLTRELERTIGASRFKELLKHTSGTFPDIKHIDALRAVRLHRSFCDSSTSTEQPFKERNKWNQKIQVATMA